MTRTGAAGTRRARPERTSAPPRMERAGTAPLGGAVRRVRTVLQPAVAVRREGYGGGRGHIEPIGQVSDQAVQVWGGRFGEVAPSGERAGLARTITAATARREQQHDQRDGGDRPARGVPPAARRYGPGAAATSSTTATAAGSRATASALLRMRSTARARERACCAPASPPIPVPDTAGLHPLCPAAALLTPPLWHPPLTSQCRWAKCRNALRRTLVGAPAGVIRMGHPSLDGMALGKGVSCSGAGAAARPGERRGGRARARLPGAGRHGRGAPGL